MKSKKEFNKIWRTFQRKRKQIFEEWKDKEELLNIWFNKVIKEQSQDIIKMENEEWAKTGGRYDCEVCGSAGHTTGECDGYDRRMKEKNKIRGKKARASGARFELRVRKDLESKGWIVSKWMNNVEILLNDGLGIFRAKLIPAKHKFRGPGIPMAIGTGFPDFIAFKEFCRDQSGTDATIVYYEIIGVECKSNGYLDKEEKEKCEWLKNNIFSKILTAKKGKKRGEIEYELK